MKARLPQGYGGGPSNIQNMLKQAQKAQEDMARLQEELGLREYDFSSGGGAVEIKMNGKKEVLELKIKPEAVDPDDIEMLEDLITAAVNGVIRIIDETAAAEMSKITGAFSMPGMF